VTRRYNGYGRHFVRGKLGKPKRPVLFPSAAELPAFQFPVKPGAGRFTHWTERRVKRDVVQFAREVLGFQKPVIFSSFKYTGNVDMIAVDKADPREPCARFEVKAAQEWITDIHAFKKKYRRRPPHRAGRFEINPAQHKREGAGCDLFYVLVPTRGKRTVEHIGICTLGTIEDIIGTKITTRRPIHRQAAFECPTVHDWIRWKRGA